MSDFRPLWPGGPLYKGESFGTDSLALADFAAGRPAKRACDLGCGAGILPLLLLQARPGLFMDGVERRGDAAALCRENMAANGWEDRARVYTQDVCALSLGAGGYDLVVSNPPYFAGQASPDPGRAARRTESAGPEEWCAAAARLLQNGGDFCLVYPAARLTDMLCSLRRTGLEPKVLRFVAHRADAAPSVFLCRAKKGGRPGLVMEPTLFQTDGSGRETAEYQKICHWEAI